MSDRDGQGRFIKGHAPLTNPIPKDLRDRLKQNKVKIINLFDSFGHKTLDELEYMMENTSTLTPAQATAITFWKTLMKDANPALLKIMFGFYGINTDIKAVAIADLDKVLDDVEESENIKDVTPPIEMTKKEKVEMLERMKQLVEDSD